MNKIFFQSFIGEFEKLASGKGALVGGLIGGALGAAGGHYGAHKLHNYVGKDMEGLPKIIFDMQKPDVLRGGRVLGGLAGASSGALIGHLATRNKDKGKKKKN